MKTRSLIRFDLLVGLPVCSLVFVATLPLRLFSRRRRGAVRRILVIKFLGLGSVLLATPMLRRLRETHPDASITFLTFESNAELVRRIDAVDEVVVVPRSSLRRLLRRLPGLLWRLRRGRFDVVLDLEFYSRLSNLVSWGTGATRRIGFFVRARWRGSLLTDPVYFNATLPFGEAVMALLRPLGLDGGDTQRLMVPSVDVEESTAAWRRLVDMGVPAAGTVVVVNVNASDLCVERRWPAERFVGLVERFERDIAPAEGLVFIGAASEAATVREVLEALPAQVRARCHDLSGSTSLCDLIVLLSRAALVISNDSGPLHLAAALQRPTVSFYGPETPTLYGPVGDDHLVFYAGHWCSPCLSVYNAKIAMCNGENECMRRIELDDVVARTAAFCRDRVGLSPPITGTPVAPGRLPLPAVADAVLGGSVPPGASSAAARSPEPGP